VCQRSTPACQRSTPPVPKIHPPCAKDPPPCAKDPPPNLLELQARKKFVSTICNHGTSNAPQKRCALGKKSEPLDPKLGLWYFRVMSNFLRCADELSRAFFSGSIRFRFLSRAGGVVPSQWSHFSSGKTRIAPMSHRVHGREKNPHPVARKGPRASPYAPRSIRYEMLA